MQHGGLLSFILEAKNIIDFSSNINPCGIPGNLKKAIAQKFTLFSQYPDINYKNLKNSISKYLKCNKENVLLGNGAVELIDNFCTRAERVITCPPCFSEYGLRADVRKKLHIKIPYLTNFYPDINTIIKTLKKNDLLVLGNPNNPSGLRLKKEEVLKIYKAVKAKHAILLLDEAFFEFCPPDYDSIKLFAEDGFSNVCIIRAATKFFSLPGIRLAYACTSKKLVKDVLNLELPWHINTAAEIAGNLIFSDKTFIKKSKTVCSRERNFLLENLNKYGLNSKVPMRPYFSECNFILIKLLKHTDIQAQKFFLKKGIFVRTCSGFEALGNNHIRIAVKEHKENAAFIECLKS